MSQYNSLSPAVREKRLGKLVDSKKFSLYSWSCVHRDGYGCLYYGKARRAHPNCIERWGKGKTGCDHKSCPFTPEMEDGSENR